MKHPVQLSLCLVLAGAAGALADPVYYQVSGSAVNSPGSPAQTSVSGDTGQNLGPVSLARSIVGDQGAASFTGWANQVNGVNQLHAMLQAGAYAIPWGGASANLTVTYQDVLHFDTSGVFRFALHLDDTIMAGIPDYHASNADVSVTELAGGIFFGHDLRTYDQPSVGLHRYDAAADIFVPAGTVQTVILQMSAVAGAYTWLGEGGQLQTATTSLDASDTGYLTITPLDGGTFHADSGATYQVVPEPGALTILSLGLVAMALRQRRH